MFGLLLSSGCAESIRTYEVPYVKQRLLGAFIETKDGLWAIKLMGNADDVAGHKDEFEQFVKSIRLTTEGKDRISWTVPAGWEGEIGSGMRHTTFRLPKNLEVSVFFFQGGGGGLLDNVNRWRGQLGLDRVRQSALRRLAKVMELADGEKAYFLDMESTRVAPLREESSSSESPFTYTKPEGWVEQPPNEFSILAFAVNDGDNRARVTVSLARGSLEANVNRWRKELVLPELDEGQVRQSLRDTTVVGKPAFLADIRGSNGKSILGVICRGGEQSLFVKMIGNSNLVARQKPAFEAFVASLDLRGGD
jgi:hypothetical protein